MSEREPPLIQPAQMCDKHQSLLVRQAGYSQKDPWQALIIVSQLVLFQGATCDDRLFEKIGDDITRIAEIGCLACFKPDSFKEVVQAAKSHKLEDIKALGEKWLKIRALKP